RVCIDDTLPMNFMWGLYDAALVDTFYAAGRRFNGCFLLKIVVLAPYYSERFSMNLKYLYRVTLRKMITVKEL
ncbi:hypothetical protein, partial [Enterobacter hormaechei]